MTERAEFLFTTWEGGGHVGPALIVARALADRGRRVLVVSDACNAADAAAFDLPFEPWRTAPSRSDKSPASDPLRDYEAVSPAETVARLCDKVLVGPAAAYARDVRALLAEHPGAVVVSQELLFGAMIGAQAEGARLALLTANLWPFPTLPTVPPFGAGFAPAEDDLGRMRDAAVREASLALYDLALPALNAVRADNGLPALARLLDQPHQADRILLGVARAFDFGEGDPPDPFLYVGPQFADPAWVEPWTPPWPSDDPQPLVAASFSTFFQGQTAVVRRVAEALAALDVRGLVLLGPALDPQDVPAPADVQVVKSAPFAAVLREASVVVTHAGHGSAVRPLLAGVPLVCLPMGRDQPDNAVRAAERGAAVVLDPAASVDAVARAVRRVLDDPRYAAAARAFGATIAPECDSRAAANALETLASGGKPG